MLAAPPIQGQTDTLKLKQEIDNLADQTAIQNYLKKIYEEDQKYRGNKTIDSLDFEHLISISYFINKFGHPKYSTYGKVSRAPSLVWIHNKYQVIKKEAFPIILKGFLNREIKEFDLRDYYLRVLYNYISDNSDHKTIELPELFKLLKLNTGPNINIEKLIREKERLEALYNQPKNILGKWKQKSESSFLDFEGKPFEVVINFDPVQIYSTKNGQYFFHAHYSDNSHEPRELQVLENGKFKYMYQQTDKYFEINPEGDLLYISGEKTILKHYKKMKE